eukprot:4315347-Prorocentrum_lima.AAC.1
MRRKLQRSMRAIENASASKEVSASARPCGKSAERKSRSYGLISTKGKGEVFKAGEASTPPVKVFGQTG